MAAHAPNAGEPVPSIEDVDRLNAKFYGAYQYPWPPMAIHKMVDRRYETVMLNQSVGDWRNRLVPEKAHIWVAGCGPNQAALTAIRFPAAELVGTDLSSHALESCSRLASELQVTNLTLREESINGAGYKSCFDYIVCTGVIHHNLAPALTLRELAQALKPNGILELMVYNRCHRTSVEAFRQALDILRGAAPDEGLQAAVCMARSMAADCKSYSIGAFGSSLMEYSEAALADAMLSPVEHTFTVASLEATASECGLEMVAPCVNPFDKIRGAISWNMEFSDGATRALYDSLPDATRWQISNLLMMEDSPLLWFYFRRSDSGQPKTTEHLRCEDFLRYCFTVNRAEQLTYVRQEEGTYRSAGGLSQYPGRHPEEACRRVLEEVERSPYTPMGTLVGRLGLENSFQAINKLRICLTTPCYPYLMVAHD